jgi:hypothetical protein
MKLNRTPLEVAVFLVVSISIEVWSRYWKRILGPAFGNDG